MNKTFLILVAALVSNFAFAEVPKGYFTSSGGTSIWMKSQCRTMEDKSKVCNNYSLITNDSIKSAWLFRVQEVGRNEFAFHQIFISNLGVLAENDNVEPTFVGRLSKKDEERTLSLNTTAYGKSIGCAQNIFATEDKGVTWTYIKRNQSDLFLEGDENAKIKVSELDLSGTFGSSDFHYMGDQIFPGIIVYRNTYSKSEVVDPEERMKIRTIAFPLFHVPTIGSDYYEFVFLTKWEDSLESCHLFYTSLKE